MLSTESAQRTYFSPETRPTHNEFTYHSKNLSGTLVLQASSELHSIKSQMNLPAGFRKTMPNGNKGCSMQHLNSPEQGIHRSSSKPFWWLQERNKMSKQWELCSGVKPAWCQNTLKCSLPCITGNSHAQDFVLFAYSHPQFQKYYEWSKCLPISTANCYLLHEKRIKSYRRNPPLQATFRTEDENRIWSYSFFVGQR